MSNAELHTLTISELAPMIRAREVSPVEVVESALAQADRHAPALNSFITLMREEAMEQAKAREADLERGVYLGPLHGIPIGIKDNIATGGVRTTVGTKVLAENIPNEDAHVVRLCKQAGAIILGKENMEEFASGVTSNNPHYGAVHNPWQLDHVPGGSSGGSGANVAARVTYASLGTDLGGSVRIPGSFCGVVGLKQTFGRVSQRGLLATSFNGDHIGPLTRSVADSALLLQALASYDSLDPSTVPVPVPDYSASLGKGLAGLKMGIPMNYYSDLLDPEVDAAVRRAIDALEELGVESEEVSIPSLRYAGALRIAGLVDSMVAHEPYYADHRQDYGPEVLYRTIGGQFVLGRDYSKSLKVQRLIKEDHARALQSVDFLVTATTPISAPRIDVTSFELGGSEHIVRGPGSSTIARLTSPSNATGLPAISVPCGLTEAGLPIGLQLICRPFEEQLLFRLAHGYEAISPMVDGKPALVDGA